jgi:MFS family permease
MAATNTLLQTLVEERMRGRVMSFYTMSFLGMTPFASLIAGFLASHFGVQMAVRIGAALSLVAVSVFALRLPKLRRQIRPIYERMGLLQPRAAEAPPAGE